MFDPAWMLAKLLRDHEAQAQKWGREGLCAWRSVRCVLLCVCRTIFVLLESAAVYLFVFPSSVCSP